MNLIDTNAITYIFEAGIQCEEIYYMAPEISDEVEMTESIFGKKLPPKIISILNHSCFSEIFYVESYKIMLNKHNGKSFFNMTGFGDISIIATVHALLKSLEKQNDLFDQTINIFSNDADFKNRVLREFANCGVSCKAYEDIK